RVAVVRGFPNKHVWVFNQNGVASRVSSFEGVEQDPIWSPDGRTLYYMASSNDKQEVTRRSLDSGATESIYRQPGVNTLRLHDITPDGQRLLATLTDSGAMSIVQVDLSTPVTARTLKVVLPAPEGSSGIGWVRIAPDGKSLFFSQFN